MCCVTIDVNDEAYITATEMIIVYTAEVLKVRIRTQNGSQTCLCGSQQYTNMNMLSPIRVLSCKILRTTSCSAPEGNEKQHIGAQLFGDKHLGVDYYLETELHSWKDLAIS